MKILAQIAVAALLLHVVACDPRRPDDVLDIAQSALTSRIHGGAQSWIRSPGDDVSSSFATVRFMADAVGDAFGFVSPAPAGTYDITLRYAKRNIYGDYSFAVNAVPLGTLRGFADDKSDEWNTATFSGVRAPNGAYITFSVTGKDPASSDYDFKIDYIDFAEVAGGTPGSGGTPGTGTGGGGGGGQLGRCAPSNPRATAQARNLLCYLYSQVGTHVLSGQQETSWSNPAGDIDFYVTNVGKSPAILGGDYLYPNGTSTRAIAYWKAGGIPMIRYHMGAPPNADSYQNSMMTANLDGVVTPGTAENQSFNSKLDYAAAEIQKLQAASVPLIWAPFHEVQANGWFWWSKGTGAQYVALWKYMYNYFTNIKHLDNILWLVPFSGSPSAAYYPGKAFADLAGPDTYGTRQPFASNYTSARAAVGTNIPLALHETGTIPQPAVMFPTTAPWLLFNVWAGFESSANTVEIIRSAYGSSFTITRDEIPDLRAAGGTPDR